MLPWNKIKGLYLAIFLLPFGCLSVPAQVLHYSKAFPALPRNLPLALINRHDGYFYVLRYNRLAHDLTLEKRAKPSAEILNFTALRMDSFNASWFDYRNLDMKLSEFNDKLCLVFKKEVNNKKSLYFIRVDSLGKSSAFTEMVSVERENSFTGFDIDYTMVGPDKVLIVISRTYFNQSTRKTVLLYDLLSAQKLWFRNLPTENYMTGYSNAFICDGSSGVYYVMARPQLMRYNRKYARHAQVLSPVWMIDTLKLMYSANSHELPVEIELFHQVNRIHGIALHTDSTSVYVQALTSVSEEETGKPGFSIYTFACSKNLQQFYYRINTGLQSSICERLRYFDGTDSEQCWDKEFNLMGAVYNDSKARLLFERREYDEYKELLSWQCDLKSGRVLSQELVPRRLLYSEAWSRYTNIGEACFSSDQAGFRIALAEAAANLDSDPASVKFPELKKRNSLRVCNLVLFTLNPGQAPVKKLLHHNGDFDYLPVRNYSSGTNDLVFYLNSGRQEKFAICELNPH
ncbi:MAG TPA: hypothetical protein PLQ93_00070 [Bacteroidia bacterium]|nr:hypothetical protein [Bacteroidia bacterium]